MNVAALLHDAPSDDHRTRNDAQHHHQHSQPPPPHEHRFPPPPYPHLPSPAAIIGLEENRYDHRPDDTRYDPRRDRDRDRERDRDRDRDRMLPPPHHPPSHMSYHSQHQLHFTPHHQQHIITSPPILPPPPPHHHVYDYPHDSRIKHPLSGPPERDRDRDRERERERERERDRFPAPPGYPGGPTSRTPPTYAGTDQGRITPVTVRETPLRRETHIAPEPVMNSLRERDRERDSPPPNLPFMPSHYAPHPPFSPNPHGAMTQPLPPPLALAPHHAPPKRRRDAATPVDGPFISDRERDRAADAREMVRERERDRQAREASLRESRDRDAVGKAKRDRERDRERAHHAKHPSLDAPLPLHPSHAQRPPPPPPHPKQTPFIIPPPPQPQTLPLAPSHHPTAKKQPQPPLGPGGHHFQPQHSQPQRILPAPAPPPPPRSPTPPAPQPPLDLGTFVFPRMPFPYFFPPDSERIVSFPGEKRDQNSSTGVNSTQAAARERERDVEFTLLIPRAHLPSSIPVPLPVWGGGLSGGATHRVYTDDSAVVLCALHAGFVTWAEVCAARGQCPGRDMRVRVRIRRGSGMWCGGPSAAGDAVAGMSGRVRRKGKEREREKDKTDESVGLVSQEWPAPHDGSGIEILAVEWLPSGAARRLHLPNRRARLAEYAERRNELMKRCEGIKLKRRRRLPNAVALDPIVEEQESEERVLIWGRAGTDIGFKFDPDVVRGILFPDPDIDLENDDREQEYRPRKRRKRDPDTKPSEPTLPPPKAETRAIVLDNDVDAGRYLVSRWRDGSSDADADMVRPRRYRISLLPRRSMALQNGKTDCPSVKTTAATPVSKPDTDNAQKQEDTDVTLDTSALPSPESPEPAPALQDIATALEESDIEFHPDGLRIAQRKVLAADDSDSLGRFVAVSRWRWHMDG